MTNIIISSPDLWTQTHIHDTSLVQKGPTSLVDLCQDLTCNQATSAGSCVISVLCSLLASSGSRPSDTGAPRSPRQKGAPGPCTAGAIGHVPTGLQSHPRTRGRRFALVNHGRTQDSNIFHATLHSFSSVSLQETFQLGLSACPVQLAEGSKNLHFANVFNFPSVRPMSATQGLS